MYERFERAMIVRSIAGPPGATLIGVAIPISKHAPSGLMSGKPGSDVLFLVPDHDFAHEVAALHVLEGKRRFFETEHAVDERTDFVLGDEGVHRFEMLP